MHAAATDQDECAAAQPEFKIPVSVLIVVYTSELEVLMLERADRPGWWQSVTGSKERHDATLFGTATRELFEETGIVPRSDGDARARLVDWKLRNVYPILPAWRHRYASAVTHNVEHVFGICVRRDITVTLAPREHLRYRWQPWSDAAAACFSHTNAQAIRRLPEHADPGRPG